MAELQPIVTSPEGAALIQRAMRNLRNPPSDRVGDRNQGAAPPDGFWGYISGSDTTGKRYSFARVMPDASGDVAYTGTLDDSLPFRVVILNGQPLVGWAREGAGNRRVPHGVAVWMRYIGQDAEGLPAYLFSYGDIQQDDHLPPHDHRDNFNGGFAFAMYHPGTDLPQMPWGM